jgi:hypothetical protein
VREDPLPLADEDESDLAVAGANRECLLRSARHRVDQLHDHGARSAESARDEPQALGRGIAAIVALTAGELDQSAQRVGPIPILTASHEAHASTRNDVVVVAAGQGRAPARSNSLRI